MAAPLHGQDRERAAQTEQGLWEVSYRSRALSWASKDS